MAVTGMYFFNCGLLTVDQSIVTYRHGWGTKIQIPVVVGLIMTTEGNVLFDTGLDPIGIEKPEEVWGEKRHTIARMTSEDDIRNRLGEVGLRPDDIRFVVNSHFHWDHTGGNQFFEHSTFIVQKSEYRFGFHPDDFVSEVYRVRQFDLPLDYHLIEDDYNLLDGVTILTTPGHTPGHQSLLVSLPETGHILLSGDALYTNLSLTEGIPPGNSWNTSQSVRSIKEMKAVTTHLHGKVAITHDPQFWEQFKPAPYRYQ